MGNCNYQVVALCITMIFAGGLGGSAQPSEGPVFVNFVIDLDLPSNVSPEELYSAKVEIVPAFRR